ncbi:Trigger factor [Trichinella pseudospiralis]
MCKPESFEKAVESAAREEPMVIQITARNTNVSLTMVSVDFDCKILRNPWEYPNSVVHLPALHERHSGVQVFGLPRTSSSEEHTSRLREVLDRLAD